MVAHAQEAPAWAVAQPLLAQDPARRGPPALSAPSTAAAAARLSSCGPPGAGGVAVGIPVHWGPLGAPACPPAAPAAAPRYPGAAEARGDARAAEPDVAGGAAAVGASRCLPGEAAGADAAPGAGAASGHATPDARTPPPGSPASSRCALPACSQRRVPMLLACAGPASAAPGPAPGNASLPESHQRPVCAVTRPQVAAGAPRRRKALSGAGPGARARRAAWSPALALLLDDVAGVLFRLSPARRRGRPAGPPSPPGVQAAPRAAAPAAAGADAHSAAAAPARPQSQAGAAAPADEAAALVQAPAAARAEAPGARAGSPAAPAGLLDAAADGASPATAAEGRAAAAEACPAGALAAPPAQPVGSRAAEGGPAAAALAAEAPAQPGPREAGAAASARPAHLLFSAAPCAAAGPRPGRACDAAGRASRVCCSALQPVTHESDAAWAGDALAEELCARIALYSRLLRRGRAALQHAYI